MEVDWRHRQSHSATKAVPKELERRVTRKRGGIGDPLPLEASTYPRVLCSRGI
jgi:hypothetical protein